MARETEVQTIPLLWKRLDQLLFLKLSCLAGFLWWGLNKERLPFGLLSVVSYKYIKHVQYTWQLLYSFSQHEALKWTNSKKNKSRSGEKENITKSSLYQHYSPYFFTYFYISKPFSPYPYSVLHISFKMPTSVILSILSVLSNDAQSSSQCPLSDIFFCYLTLIHCLCKTNHVNMLFYMSHLFFSSICMPLIIHSFLKWSFLKIT